MPPADLPAAPSSAAATPSRSADARGLDWVLLDDCAALLPQRSSVVRSRRSGRRCSACPHRCSSPSAPCSPTPTPMTRSCRRLRTSTRRTAGATRTPHASGPASMPWAEPRHSSPARRPALKAPAGSLEWPSAPSVQSKLARRAMVFAVALWRRSLAAADGGRQPPCQQGPCRESCAGGCAEQAGVERRRGWPGPHGPWPQQPLLDDLRVRCLEACSAPPRSHVAVARLLLCARGGCALYQ
jgi:hypothetical protein